MMWVGGVSMSACVCGQQGMKEEVVAGNSTNEIKTTTSFGSVTLIVCQCVVHV